MTDEEKIERIKEIFGKPIEDDEFTLALKKGLDQLREMSKDLKPIYPVELSIEEDKRSEE